MVKLLQTARQGFRPVYLKETYPYTPDSDIYIGSQILEVPEPFVDDVKHYINQLVAMKPVGYVKED